MQSTRQPGGFSSEEEALFQQAEVLKYSLDELERQQQLQQLYPSPDQHEQQGQ